MRELGWILQGVAFVYAYQRQRVEKGAKLLLQELNGDALWQIVQRKQKLRGGE